MFKPLSDDLKQTKADHGRASYSYTYSQVQLGAARFKKIVLKRPMMCYIFEEEKNRRFKDIKYDKQCAKIVPQKSVQKN